MKSSRIQSFISEAQRELSKITPQIEALTEKRNSLQEVVTGGLKLLKKQASQKLLSLNYRIPPLQIFNGITLLSARSRKFGRISLRC